MVFVDKSFRQMMEEIEFQRFILNDRISPAQNPDLFRRDIGRIDSKPVMIIRGDYIMEILSGLELPDINVRYLVSHQWRENVNTYEYLVEGLMREGMLNSYERGHNCEDNLKISFRVAEGLKGYILRFRDQGPGFDYKDKIQRLKAGHRFWKRLGSCFGYLDAEHIESAYEGRGNILNVKLMRRTSDSSLSIPQLENVLAGVR